MSQSSTAHLSPGDTRMRSLRSLVSVLGLRRKTRQPRLPEVESLEDRSLLSTLQWASSVRDFSSQYTSNGWSAARALGAPTVTFYGDNADAWAPVPMNGTLEHLTLGFATPVYATGVTVRETYGNGFVYRVDLLDTTGAAHTVWSGLDPSLPGSPVNFDILFAETDYQVNGVKVFVDTNRHLGAWEEIDAVQLAGNLTPSYQPPVAAADRFSTLQNTPLTGNVLANDTAPSGLLLSAQLVSGPNHGSLALAADGSFTYTPAHNYFGADSFSYVADDGRGSSTPATVNIDVVHVNQPPTALDVGATTKQGKAVAINVLATASDPDPGAVLVVSGFSQGANGSVTRNGDGTLTYTPRAGFFGSDSFTYTVSDEEGAAATGRVTITVQPGNQPPTAANGSFTTNQGVNVRGSLAALASDPDGDKLSFKLASKPKYGVVKVDADGSFKYTPNARYAGRDSFSYKVVDSKGNSAAATVQLNVTRKIKLSPGGRDHGQVTVHRDYRLTGQLFDHHDRRRSRVASVLGSAANVGRTVKLGSGAELTIQADGRFTYRAPARFSAAEDSFQVTVNDGRTLIDTTYVVRLPWKRR